MATRRSDEHFHEAHEDALEERRWRDQDARWPRSGEVGEHDRPWHQPEETWPERRGMYGMGGASRAYNQGGYGGRGVYERGYAMGSYDTLADISRNWFGPDREGYADERTLRAAWEIPSRSETVHDERHEGRDRWGGYHAGGKAPKGYIRSDERILDDVCERLMRSPLDVSDVEVKVENSEVTLKGTARSRHEKRLIEDLAGAVRGVHDVHNRLRVSSERPAHVEPRLLHS